MDCNRRGFIDLHVHTTASDGSLSPVDLLALADQKQLAAIAITDHDTIAGSVAALSAGMPEGLEFLTGVEISASRPPAFPGPGSFHLLGYGIRLDDPELNRTLERLQHARRDRNPKIIERLNRLGIPLDYEAVLAAVPENTQLGRPHIAAALVQNGIVGTVDDAFDRFLGTGKPAYVDKFRISCERAVQMIVGAGGIPVLAHPGLLAIRRKGDLDALVRDLKSMGLMGIEAFYPQHTPAQTETYLQLARQHGLLITGGTDFHGAVKPEIDLGVGSGSFRVSYEWFEKLIARLPHPPSRASAL